MYRSFCIILFMITGQLVCAADLGQIIFEDDFERTESQEKTDEPGNGWGTNSNARAQGDKQVDLKDGTMRIFISPRADHGVSVTHPMAFTDGAVALRFKLESPQDSLGLNFADLSFKGVHAGHLFVVKISPKKVELTDLKTGNMRIDIRTARTEKQVLTQEQKQALVGKSKKLNHTTSVNQWHDLLVTVTGDTLSLTIDRQAIGAFHSPGIAHPTKRLLRLAVPKNAVVDDVTIYRTK